MNDYEIFLNEKQQCGSEDGFEPLWIPDCLFDFQKFLVEWAIRKGRGAIFADCGMGKTLMELVWAENVRRKTNKPVLILTPLAVAWQVAAEADKFGIEAEVSNAVIENKTIVTNYERLHFFNPNDFSGVVCDESSILKSFDGSTRHGVTEFMRKVPYRLLATATAAPNDYTELGTSSEALGYLGHMDMLNRFFKNDQNNSGLRRHYGEAPKWRFKGHSQIPFWRWVCSWARAVRKPSDIGFADKEFILPKLTEEVHRIEIENKPADLLFNLPAISLEEQRDERRRTITERCEKVSELAAHGNQVLIWCHLNDEGDLLEKMVDGAVQVSGQDSDEAKEKKFIKFTKGEIRVLVTKPKIGAWGLNFQNCSRIVAFPSHSYEQYYQGIRRCWRFGQRRPVHVDIVTTEGERRVFENLKRKSVAADKMFSNLIEQMNNGLKLDSGAYGTKKEEIPTWLSLSKKSRISSQFITETVAK